ncbi:MAG TPA: hypothetical protein PLS29_04570 [Acidimicrobiales bacterium]|nr:MAG: hypothetical protein B7Z69_06895 [Actinobacteria bacterium 21-73-9]HQU26289.1 hypothetical protein [Acidimicrobiales bacterium]
MSRLVAVLAVAVPLALGPGAGAATWSWRATGTLADPVVCPRPGHAIGRSICAYRVPNAPRAATREAITVTIANGGPRRACYGLSISTSVAAGLRQLCVGAHRTGRLRLAGPARDYRATSLELFATSGSTSRPIAPQRALARGPFVLRATT